LSLWEKRKGWKGIVVNEEKKEDWREILMNWSLPL
jgi:hypothetical protein